MKTRIMMVSSELLVLLSAFLIVFCWNNVVYAETPVSVSNTCATNTSLLKEVSKSDSMKYPKTKSVQVEQMLKHGIAQMRSAQQEVEHFAERKASQKTKSYSWYIAEIVTNAGEIIVMRSDFFTENGPMSFATKRVYQDEKHTKELKEKGYVLYYHENGGVKMFQTRGTPETIVQFYPSGKVKEFGVVDGDKTLAEIRCGENDTVEYEKYSVANTNQTEEMSLLTATQDEMAIDHILIKTPEIKALLRDAFRKMKTSDVEVKAFADRKASKKVKSGFWTVSEECETNGVIVCMKVDFFTETGPIRFGAKVVYQDKTYRKDLKDQRYQIYYHENGKFQTFLNPTVTLLFYPSGRVKQFCLSAVDNSVIAAFDGGDDDSITHEVYNGSKIDAKEKTEKDKGKQ